MNSIGLRIGVISVLVMGALAAGLTWKMQAPWSSLGVVAIIGFYLFIAHHVYVEHRYWIPIVMPVAGAMLLNHVALQTYNIVFEQRDKRRVTGVFAKLVSPNVVTQLLQRDVIRLEGKREKITITNEKGRLSKEDIEKMVQEAEKFKDEDNKIKARIEAKNGLENYCFQMKNTLNDEKLKDKFTDADRKVIEDANKEGLQFIESAGDSATADEFNKKLKEIEAKFNPIMMRVYQQAGGGAGGMPGGMPGGFPGAGSYGGPGAGSSGNDDDGPKIEEID